MTQFQGVPRRVLDQLLPPARRPGQASPTTAKAETGVKNASSAPVKSKSAKRSAPKKSADKTQRREPPSAYKPKIHDKILEIIAQEVGVEPKDLTPDSTLDECGVDSLLSLNISN